MANIEKLEAFTRVPTQDEPAHVIVVPENSQAMVFHVLTESFESHKHGCTTHKGVWFPCPAPVLLRESDKGELQMVCLVSRELFDIPPAAGDNYTVEFGALKGPTSPQNTLIR